MNEPFFVKVFSLDDVREITQNNLKNYKTKLQKHSFVSQRRLTRSRGAKRNEDSSGAELRRRCFMDAYSYSLSRRLLP